MALLELSLAVAHVLFTYDFRVPGGEVTTLGKKLRLGREPENQEDEFQLFANVTSLCKGPWLEFRKR